MIEVMWRCSSGGKPRGNCHLREIGDISDDRGGYVTYCDRVVRVSHRLPIGRSVAPTEWPQIPVCPACAVQAANHRPYLQRDMDNLNDFEKRASR